MSFYQVFTFYTYYSYAAAMLSNLHILPSKTQIFSMRHSARWPEPQLLSTSHDQISFPHGRKHRGKSPAHTSEPGVRVHNPNLDRVVSFLQALNTTLKPAP